ncbi:hypothetical protein [Mesoflavibacter zeaxanthinifaciens]|uniref:hypothetical protein n=1 Tax=Mesoflavibacter zeaxanthinifaciens TaxID=393060 RepID=UPI003A92B683
MKDKFIDIHTHPSLKPFGRSYHLKSTIGLNTTKKSLYRSIWRTDQPKMLQFDKVLNKLLSVTKFTQSDFYTVHRGGGRIMIIVIGPIELGFVNNSLGNSRFSDLLTNFAGGFHENRINYMQNDFKNYFDDLELEYDYLKQINEEPIKLSGEICTYKLINSIDEYDDNLENTIHVVLSFEGAHVFNTGMEILGQDNPKECNVIKNVKTVKEHWDHKPFFVTLAHHFPNQLCGQAKSFPQPLDKIYNQQADPKVGILDLGFKVIKELLRLHNGRRIFIDLKHMNAKSRYQYYNFIKENCDFHVPLIVSHGAVNRYSSPLDLDNQSKEYAENEINFFDDEIFKISNSKGIFGIQLDKRRLLYKSDKNFFKDILNYDGYRKRRKSSFLIWRQIEYIALYLDSKGENAWDIQSIGSDFDGIINPLNGFWTSAYMPHLGKWIITRAKTFLKSNRSKNLLDKNKLSPELIAEKIMFNNAKRFLDDNFKIFKDGLVKS